jgi:hypothetical protein
MRKKIPEKSVLFIKNKLIWRECFPLVPPTFIKYIFVDSIIWRECFPLVPPTFLNTFWLTAYLVISGTSDVPVPIAIGIGIAPCIPLYKGKFSLQARAGDFLNVLTIAIIFKWCKILFIFGRIIFGCSKLLLEKAGMILEKPAG